ncbi:hypothetical protein BDV93DRAFT_528178 [Ceratobasidium sp. AG-I]|nr:hypothetical protein BDV93DRAFT_528178 [Ceratobasidium sp. AG-I]
MAHETESPTSSPVSISGIESISDVDSAIIVGEDNAGVLGAQESSEDALFELGDGDIRLMVDGTTLETHKYIIKRFSRLKNRIQNNTITFGSEEPRAQDFRNMFKILYASVVEGPFEFDQLTLASALRIATLYDYPTLRTYAIQHLEKTPLSAVERIRLAREFVLPSWEEPAYVELCNREEALTKEEASVLGMDAFVHVAKIREKEQRRRGKELDAGCVDATKGKDGPRHTISTATKGDQAKDKMKDESGCSGVLESGLGGGKREQATETASATKRELVIPQPSFINLTLKGTYQHTEEPIFGNHLLIPGCRCKVEYGPEDSRTIKAFQATLTSLTAIPEPTTPSSEDLNQIGSVQEEVRKWLASVEGCTTTL